MSHLFEEKYGDMPEREVIDLAIKHVCDLATGRKRWTMCIPTRWDDSDILLCEGLRRASEKIQSLLLGNQALEDRLRMLGGLESGQLPKGQEVSPPKIGSVWRHFKGELVEVVGYSTCCETKLMLILYQHQNDRTVTWSRPWARWNDREAKMHGAARFTLEEKEET